MAQAALTPNHHSIKAFHGLGLLVLLLLMQRAGATQFKVGGSSGWSVPTDPTAYNQWAQKHRFRIGDSLLFVYPPGKDSVLHVKKDDYYNCNTKSFLEYYNDGNTPFIFNQSGPHYFISGNEENCLKNESMVVIVMAGRSKMSNSTINTTAPSPSPYSPSNPPEINPTSPSPSALPPAVVETPNTSPPSPPNGVSSSKVVSIVGSIGLVGSGLLLVL
ncbi:hypothetical protein MRB53_030633 [Persea americana]|uniref:Uncharacterized protein n=1 Tax=Persea americana TaxID=3435 RepID=A0ACC2KLT1_PERAE|nr:hypothetical protein MRB53_030633 [Persea americana]